jgi:hypothetical protein
MSVPEARFHYPLRNLWPDYARAAAGFALTMLPLPNAIGGNVIVLTIVLALAVLFGSFGITTFLRHKSIVAADELGIWITGLRGKALRWDEIAEVDMRYFSTRREKDKGWMQLRLSGKGQKLKVDSNLEDFDGLIRHVVTAITRHDLVVTPIGKENLASMNKTVPTREDTA